MILFITPSYKPAYTYGGTIFSVAALAEAISIQMSCKVFTSDANGHTRLGLPAGREQQLEGVPVHYFHSVIAGNVHLVPAMYWAVLMDRKSTVVHVHSWWNLVAIPISIIALIKGKKLVISPRGMLSPYSFEGKPLRKVFQQLIGNWIMRKASIHATSEQERDQLLHLNPRAKIIVIPNILPLMPFHERQEVSADILHVLFLSRIHPKKNLDQLIRALPNMPNVQLRVVGDGDQNYIDSLKLLAKENGADAQIIWHEAEYDSELKAALFAKASLFVLLSHDENFANNIVEALMCNCPVLVSSKVGVAPFVVEHKLGWVYTEGETNLVELMLQIHNDRAQRDSISKRARQIAIDNFLSKSNIDKYLALYE